MGKQPLQTAFWAVELWDDWIAGAIRSGRMVVEAQEGIDPGILVTETGKLMEVGVFGAKELSKIAMLTSFVAASCKYPVWIDAVRDLHSKIQEIIDPAIQRSSDPAIQRSSEMIIVHLPKASNSSVL